MILNYYSRKKLSLENEDELVRNMLSSSWIDISCSTKEEGVEERRALIEDKSKVYINKLFKTGFEGTFVKTKVRIESVFVSLEIRIKRLNCQLQNEGQKIYIAFRRSWI